MKDNKKDRWLTREAQSVDVVLNCIDHNEEVGSREMRGSIAGLSRIAGRLPEEDAKSLSIAIRLLSDAGLPLRTGYGDDVLTDGERAAVISLALYSVAARQSYKPNGMSFGDSMGRAVRADPKGSLGDVMKSITYDDDLTSLAYDLSRSIRRIGDIGVDYAVLTNDLMQFQNPDNRQRVLNRWVKDYYRAADRQPDPTDGLDDSRSE